MKKIIFLVLLAQGAKAQFLGGFFSQQSDKEKLMLTQIAEYDVYLHALKTGYTITQAGLNTAQQLKGGTFNLHTAYFKSLAQVNPVVSNNPKGKAIISVAAKIGTVFSTEVSFQQQQKQLSSAEMTYLRKVYDNLVSKCQTDINDLTAVLTPGKLQLTDQERLDRLDKIYAVMQDKYAFSCSFTAKCHTLATSRAQAKNSKSQLKQLYGIQ
ncbi:hypothetical protein ACFS5N_05625 [Mucilaginibacter ximonensis]|uniref:TerB family tellurite resistance protein n=1 Tax=Mucilaginibacter ximonensis TaxID=538021 RepID=A0ABW5YAX5_9SPHI